MSSDTPSAKQSTSTRRAASDSSPRGGTNPGISRNRPDVAGFVRHVLGYDERTVREVQLVVNKAAMRSMHQLPEATLTVAIVAPAGADVRHLASQIARLVEAAAGGKRQAELTVVPTLFWFNEGDRFNTPGPWLVQYATTHEGTLDHQLCRARANAAKFDGAGQLLMIEFPDDRSLEEFITDMPAFGKSLHHVVHLGAGTPAQISAHVVQDLGFRSITVLRSVGKKLAELIPHIEGVVIDRSGDLARELADQLDILATANKVHAAHVRKLGTLYNVRPSSGVASEQLAAMSGLVEAKSAIANMLALKDLPTLRTQGLHSIFTGPPGTGKSTVAALMAQLLHEAGLISRPVVRMATRSDLIGIYIGQTAPKVRRVCEMARGGVLFIDEAYSLVTGENDIYGQEAIAELIQFMEANRNDIVIVLAGYGPAMAELLSQNEGLASRFPFIVPFTPLAPEQLTELLVRQLAQEQLALSPLARWAIDDFHGRAHCDPTYGSARGVRALAQQMAGAFLGRTKGDRNELIDIPDLPVGVYTKETTSE